MKTTHAALSVRYLAGLRTHLGEKRAGNGDRAQGLGRASLARGLATRDLARMHERAVKTLAANIDFAQARNGAIARAGYFLTQALIPLETAERATRQSHRHLQERNRRLRQHTTALVRGNRRLQREIARRQAGELVVKDTQQQYRGLLRESQLMQRKLRQLTRQIISAQEEERTEISRELHDEVVQTLVGINVELSTLTQETSEGLHSMKAKIAHTQRLVEHSVNAVHRFARELRPAVLDDLGLIPALHAYVKALAARKKIKVHLTAFAGVEELSIADRTVLYRVAQEALTNVSRHAQATHIRMSIIAVGDVVRMEISDNGKSFQVDKTLLGKNSKRLGLIGMRERIEMIGGHLTVDSLPGAGTTVSAEIPFKREKTKT